MPESIGGEIDVSEDGALRAMFRARKEVFVDLLKWDLPVLADRFEVDQFDTQAEYLILLEKGIKHRASPLDRCPGGRGLAAITAPGHAPSGRTRMRSGPFTG